MKSTSEKLKEISKYGYTLEFGPVLEQSFENYKKIALITGAILLLLVIIFYAVLFGALGVFLGIGSVTDTLTGFSTGATSTTAMLISTFVSVIGAALIAPLSAGILKIAHQAETYKEFGFSTAFDHYKSKSFKDIFMGTLILTFFSQGIGLFFEVLVPYTENGILHFWLKAIAIIISVIISYMTFLMIPLIIFGGLRAGEAIKGSILLVSKKFFVILLLIIVCFMCAMIGIIGICIGIFFTFPIMYSLQYIVYRNAVAIDENDELDEIGMNTEAF